MSSTNSVDASLDITTADIFGIALALNDLFIFVPSLLYSLYQFHKIRNTDIMKERKHKLVYYMHMHSIIAVSIFQPFNVVVHLQKSLKSVETIMEWIAYAVQTSFVCGIYSLFLSKIWLLYFKQQYHITLAAQVWEKVINSRFNSWYVMNKKRWGNDAFILKFIALPVIFCVVIDFFLYHSNFRFLGILITCVILVIPTLLFWYRLNSGSSSEETHKIKTEIGYQCVIMTVIVMCYLVKFILGWMGYLSHATDGLILIAIGDFALFFMSISCSVYPLYLFNTAEVSNKLVLSMVTTTSSNNSNSNKCSLNEMLHVISRYHGFQSFMLHLVSECCTENLFFITELVQIKSGFQIKHNNILKLPKVVVSPMVQLEQDIMYQTIDFHVQSENNPHRSTNESEEQKRRSTNESDTIETMPASTFIFSTEGDIFCRITLPIGIPRSEILSSYPTSFVNQLHELYLKYIKIGCVHSINISAAARNIITVYFKDFEKDTTEEKEAGNQHELDCKIFTIMDEACLEIVRLMYSPFSRFYQSQKRESVESERVSKAEFIGANCNNEAIHTVGSFSLLQRQYDSVKYEE